MNDNSLKFLHIGENLAGRDIAVRAAEGAAQIAAPGLVWLGGYKSDMKGTKAAALADWAKSKAAPASASTIRDTANWAAPSPTARSRAGSPRASWCSTPAAAVRRS